MKQFRIPVCFFLFSLLTILLLSCNNSTDSSTDKSAEVKPVSEEMTTDKSSDSSELRDSYWIEQSVGTSNAEKKKQLANKVDGLLVFHADDTMQVNSTYKATLALARNASMEKVKAKVLEYSEATDTNVIFEDSLELGKRVRANLMDPSPANNKNFRIDQFGKTDEQSLTNSKEAYWQWNIEPLKEGQHKLVLSIQVIFGDNDEKNLPVRNIPVIIFAKKVSFAAKVGNFFSNYWQWVITGILLPVFIAWLTTRIRQSGEKKK